MEVSPMEGSIVEKVDVEPRLMDMSTQWSLVFKLNDASPEEANRAAAQLMGRYVGAVHRYLLKALRDPDAAQELDQEFALRFLRGDFRHGDPTRGRFRDYVKRAVQNLMKDYYRRKRPVASLDSGVPEPAVEDEGLAQFDRQFLQSWRNDLLDRSWNAVKELEERTGQPYYTVLRTRVDHPEQTSKGWADRLAEALGRPISPGAFRQTLQRARRAYANHLIGEVAGSLNDLRPQALEEELADLELLEYCRPYLKRRG
ncbi:MAG: RNA polymerase sigma factor [Isosphaeraceae bacterium]